MYTRFFGLNEKPFSITPDPRYLYLSERHREALAHLIYGIKESGGFIQLTGEVGTGKTTLVRTLLQQLPDFADVAVVLNPQLSRTEFLTAICEELHVGLPEAKNSIKALTDALNGFLLTNHSLGRRTILIVDEAQNLKVDVLEQIRLLTNLETAKQKLLQIILIGQPELRELLARNDMRQLAQRITGRYHLEPLEKDEAIAYVDHRLRVAGAMGPIFSPQAKRELYRLSAGVPRMINVIADRALLGGYAVETHQITPELVRKAATEVYDRPFPGRLWLTHPAVIAAVVPVAVAILLVSAWMGAQWLRGQAPPPVTPATAAPATPAPFSDGEFIPASETVPVLGLLESGHPDRTGTDTAFATLFRLWNLDYEAGPKRACLQAEEQGLFCLYQRGDFAQVQALGRPVILTLRDSASNPHQVVLSGLGGQSAVLDIADERLQVSAAELERYWFGEYLLLWRPQTTEVKSFIRGMRDPDVRWLRESLAAIQGKPVDPMGSELYDENLEARVREYQQERRLPVDGIAGQVTQVAINTELGIDGAPRLTSAF